MTADYVFPLKTLSLRDTLDNVLNNESEAQAFFNVYLIFLYQHTINSI